MADDIKVVVKVVGQQDIVKTTKSLKAMENGVKSLSKDLDKGRISEDQYNTGLKELRRTVDSSFSSWQKAKSAVDNYSKAVLQASDAAKQAKIDKEVEKVSASYNRLKASIDPVFAAQQRMKKAHAEIRAALKAEVITRDEAAASLRRYRTALKNGQVAGQALNKGMNRTGVLAQQAGYQFGDFAVQVQSGTNVFVAFGQQATQLVGTFSMLAKTTKMISLFAGLGVIIPILTGIGAYLMRVKDEAKEVSKEVDTLDDKIKSLSSTLEDYADTLAAIAAGTSLDKLFATRNVSSATKELRDAQEVLDSLNLDTKSAGDRSGALRTSKIEGATEEYMAALEAVNKAKKVLADLEAKESDTRARNFEKNSLAMDQEIALLREQAVLGVDSAEAKNLAAQQELNNRIASIEAQRVSGELDEDQANSLKLKVRIAAEFGKQIEANNAQDRAEETLANLQEQAAIQSLINQYGKDSTKVAAERLQVERKNFKAMVDSWEVSQDLKDELLAAYDAAKNVAGAALDIGPALQSAVNQANAFSDAMGRAASNSAGIGISTAGINAQIAALEGGSSKVEATAKGAAATLRAELTAALPSFEAGPRSSASIDRQVQERYSTTLERENARAKLSSMTKSDSSGGGSGGGSNKASAEGFKEYLDGLKQQAELEEKLVGLFGEKRAEEEAVIQARQKYGEAFGETQEAELRGTLRQIEAEKERQRVLEEARQQQESLADSMASSFGDAFTSVVDGTKSMKDAFRDMAKDIIKQLFEVLVVQRLVGSAEQGKESGIAGFLVKGLGAMMGGGTGGSSIAPAVPSANGNVLSNGIIQAYANGGVVGGPTYFPMAGGKTGLMGEAGPEAIMPLKRGANGKLGVQTDGGSQGNVVVNQSFNFSANGDDSVKKLIAQAAPQIANMTKQSMMNERRRGGQMKATFG